MQTAPDLPSGNVTSRYCTSLRSAVRRAIPTKAWGGTVIGERLITSRTRSAPIWSSDGLRMRRSDLCMVVSTEYHWKNRADGERLFSASIEAAPLCGYATLGRHRTPRARTGALPHFPPRQNANLPSADGLGLATDSCLHR